MVKLGVAVPLVTSAVLVTAALVVLVSGKASVNKQQQQQQQHAHTHTHTHAHAHAHAHCEEETTESRVGAEQARPAASVSVPQCIEYVACECSDYVYSAYEEPVMGRGCKSESESESSACDEATLGRRCEYLASKPTVQVTGSAMIP